MGILAKLLSFVRVERNGAKLSDVKVDPGGGPNVTAEHFAPIGEDAHPLPGDYVVTSDVRGTGREAVIGYVDPKNESKAQPGDKLVYSREPSEDGAGRIITEQWLKNDGTIITNAYKLIGADIKLISRIVQSPDGFVSNEVFDENDTLKVTTEISSDGTATTFNENGSVTLRPDGGTITTTPESTFDAAADGSIKGDNGSGSFELAAGGDFLVNGVTIDTSGNITSPATVSSAAVEAPSVKAGGKELAGHDHPAGTPPGNTGPNN